MSCTPRRQSTGGSGGVRRGRRSALGRAETSADGGAGIPVARGARCIVATLFALVAGCSDGAQVVSTRWDVAAAPRTVHVLFPENRTVTPLDAVGFGGVLDRMVHGPRPLDVEQILRRDLAVVLSEKGYDVTGSATRPSDPTEEAEEIADGVDAVLAASFDTWDHDRGGLDRIATAIRIEIRPIGGGEPLFVAREDFVFRDERDGTPGRFIERGLLGAARSLLAKLPDASLPAVRVSDS